MLCNFFKGCEGPLQVGFAEVPDGKQQLERGPDPLEQDDRKATPRLERKTHLCLLIIINK